MTANRAALVGEAPAGPGPTTSWLTPDASKPRGSAWRLLVYTGWSLEEFLERFPLRTNLVDWVLPRGVRGSDWDREYARWFGVSRVMNEVRSAGLDRVVILGKRAAGAFTWTTPTRPNWFEWSRVSHAFGSTAAVCVPHPSGASGWWNSPINRETAREFFEAWNR